MIGCVILMCAGRAERWGNHLDVHKHLIKIDGEPLLDRTIRLIRKHTAAPIIIVAFDPQYSRDGCQRLEPSHGPTDFCDTDKFLSSADHWSGTGQTVILYGDVFFTPDAMQTILTHRGPYQFFGRGHRSYYTGRRWGEMFALSISPDHRQFMENQMLHLRARLTSGQIPRGGGWDLYRQLHGRTWKHFKVIDDFTDDFDYPADYDQWLRRWTNPLHRRFAPIYYPLIKTAKWRWKQVRRMLGLPIKN